MSKNLYFTTGKEKGRGKAGKPRTPPPEQRSHKANILGGHGLLSNSQKLPAGNSLFWDPFRQLITDLGGGNNCFRSLGNSNLGTCSLWCSLSTSAVSSGKSY